MIKNGLHVKYPLFLSFLMELEFSQQIFEKHPTIIFNENPSSCSTWTDGETNMMKLIFTFRNFANAPKNATRGASEHFE
jgi:hypothetical protein